MQSIGTYDMLLSIMLWNVEQTIHEHQRTQCLSLGAAEASELSILTD